jgi:hypothetical protein
MGAKICCRCKKNPPKPGQGYCGPCRTEYNKERTKRPREEQVVRGTNSVIYNRWYQMTKTAPNITLEEVIAFEEKFTGHCDICSTKIAGRARHADHCHETGKLRGWLCSRCNQALGLLRDDPEILRKAIQYLGKNN